MQGFEHALSMAVDHGGDAPVEHGALPSMDLLSKAVFVEALSHVAHGHMGAADLLFAHESATLPEEIVDPFYDADNGPSDVSEVERYLSFEQREDTLSAVLGTGQNDPFLSGPDVGSIPPETRRTAQDIARDLLRSL